MRIDRRTMLLGASARAGRRADSAPPAQAPRLSARARRGDRSVAGRRAGHARARRPSRRCASEAPIRPITTASSCTSRRPRMAVFRPARPNGAAVLIMPGGGYTWVVVDKEGYEMARWLAARGRHRLRPLLPPAARRLGGGAGRRRSPTRSGRCGWSATAQRCGVDPRRVCAMGFSAGGHVCADLLTRFAARLCAGRRRRPPLRPARRGGADLSGRLDERADRPCRLAPQPDRRERRRRSASALIRRTSTCPPTRRPPSSSTPRTMPRCRSATACCCATRCARGASPAEAHLFPDGGHGFGLRLARGKSRRTLARPVLRLGPLRRDCGHDRTSARRSGVLLLDRRRRIGAEPRRDRADDAAGDDLHGRAGRDQWRLCLVLSARHVAALGRDRGAARA